MDKWKVARIIDVNETTRQMQLHYDGWSATWDTVSKLAYNLSFFSMKWARAGRNRVHAFKVNTPTYTG